MNSPLSRGVPNRPQPMSCREANDAEIGQFAALIAADPTFLAGNPLMPVENWLVGSFFSKLLDL